MNKRWYESLLLIVFIAVAALAAALQLTGGQRGTLADIAINVTMLVIVGIVFFNCWRGSLKPMGEIITDLDEAAARIRDDARDSHEYLMTPYKNNHVELFKSERLRELYRDFLFEFERSSESADNYIKCDIEDYVNADLVDSVLRRPQLNQVAGAMTGLGILGTFIGLSMGLQSFNTGSTAEITGSIEPLMNGIKVAFHTSIYGMIFSLVFNYVYKRRSYEAEASVSEFVSAFRKYVLPDTASDGINLLIAASREQAVATNRLAERVAEEIDRVTGPQFERLSQIITDFANTASREQAEALDRVVSAFIERMNASLAGSFTKIAGIVDSQYDQQRENAGLMRAVLDETGQGAAHFTEINRRAGELISAITDYSRNVETIQNEISRAVNNAADVNNDTLALLNQNKDQLKVEKELLIGLQGTLTGMTKKLTDSTASHTAAAANLTDALDDLRLTAEKLGKKTAKRV